MVFAYKAGLKKFEVFKQYFFVIKRFLSIKIQLKTNFIKNCYRTYGIAGDSCCSLFEE
jgi:hypothetical protein